MLIRVMAAVFAAYEVYKLLNAAAFCELYEQIKTVGNLETVRHNMLKDPFFRRVLLLELTYMFFAFALLFTPFWYFPIVLGGTSIALTLADTKGRAGRIALSAASAILAALLMNIVTA
ncbi:MAG TPA: hypothetical protein DCQ14_07360 [Firmicutes bacterium]|nr:hypothetical protein [Bacillota bacterium]